MAILEEALGVRAEMARLLGYESWAAYSLEVKMAKQTDAVLEFLIDLEERLQPKLGVGPSAVAGGAVAADR